MESGLADAVGLAEEVRSALSRGLGMRLAECHAESLEEGESSRENDRQVLFLKGGAK